MRLSTAALAAVQPRTVNAAKLILRIISAFLAIGWKRHRRPGGEDSGADRAHRPGPQEPAAAPIRRRRQALGRWLEAAGWSCLSRGWRRCFARGPTQLPQRV